MGPSKPDVLWGIHVVYSPRFLSGIERGNSTTTQRLTRRQKSKRQPAIKSSRGSATRVRLPSRGSRTAPSLYHHSRLSSSPPPPPPRPPPLVASSKANKARTERTVVSGPSLVPSLRPPLHSRGFCFPGKRRAAPCSGAASGRLLRRRSREFGIDLGKMSEVFEGYERQYCELSANLSRKCTSASAADGELKKQRISEIKVGIDEAESLIRKMDLEARSLQPNVKAVLLAKLREYKSDLNNLKSEVKRLLLGNLAARDELMESGMADTLMASADQRARLMTSTGRLNHSGERIKESRRTMLETEELGVSILQDLHQQRQSLLHANNTLHGVDDNVGKSKRILTAMSRRMNRNKWIIGAIIAVLVIAVGLILYFKFK
ncbi:hypothetical protein NL676_014812 [Syzygium grande]|nr:hypothetical protein NL676_014812 [Syzygium grande]